METIVAFCVVTKKKGDIVADSFRGAKKKGLVHQNQNRRQQHHCCHCLPHYNQKKRLSTTKKVTVIRPLPSLHNKTKTKGDSNVVSVVVVTFHVITKKRKRRLVATKKTTTTLSLPSLLQ